MHRLARPLAPPVLALALPIWFASVSARAADSPPTPRPDPMSATSAVAALHFAPASQSRLDNGLTVVLEEDHRAPIVAMQLRYDSGSSDDPPGKDGVATLAQRMMTTATKHVPTGLRDETLDHIGATDRGWSTGLDWSSEWATVPSNAVDSILWLWSDEMGFFTPDDPDALADARAAHARQKSEKGTSASLGAMNEIVARALFPADHPYGSVPLAATGDGVTLGDVREFHDRNFAPNRAVLVLVGDFQSSNVLERIATYFAPIAAGAARGAPALAPAQLEGEVRLNVAADVKAPEVWMDWRTPPFFAAGDAELDVAARAVVGTRVAVLRWTLIDKMQIATRVTAHQASHRLGSDCRISATVAPGHTAEEVIAAIDGVLGGLRKRGLSDDAFAGARANVTVPYVHSLDSLARRASVYAELVTEHRDPRALAGDVSRYDAVTRASVNATIAHWLTKGHRVVSVVTPDPQAPPGGELRATGGAK